MPDGEGDPQISNFRSNASNCPSQSYSEGPDKKLRKWRTRVEAFGVSGTKLRLMQQVVGSKARDFKRLDSDLLFRLDKKLIAQRFLQK